MENEINVNLPEGIAELTIRKGEAPKVLQPVKIEFSGDITAPGNYFEDRNNRKLFKADTAHVRVNKDTAVIVLIEDERSENRTLISGQLKHNDELMALGIMPLTKGIPYEKSQLVRLFKFNKRFFIDKDVHKKIMEGLATFNYTRTVYGESKDDQKGNFREVYEQKLKQNIQLKFSLKMPLFKGFEEKSFNVEIVPEITDGSTTFFLESVELNELYLEQKEKIINEQIKRFKSLLILHY